MSNRILIVGPSWVGDMVMAQTLFKVLKQKKPDCLIDVLAPAWSLPILERMPEVRNGLVLPFSHGELNLKARYQLGKSLRGQYDRAIILPNSLKSALIPAFTQIAERIGWRGEMRYGLLNDIRLLNKKTLPLMVQRFTALAHKPGHVLPADLPSSDLPYPKLNSSEKLQQKILSKLNLSKKQKILALCPGAEFGNAKQWPEEHYAAVAQQKILDGWQVFILGSAKDKQTAENILTLLAAKQQPSCYNLAGLTQLEETIDLIALSDAVISNDSGLMHIAAATQTPLLVVYGSTSPEFTPPLSGGVEIMQSKIDCAPCFERQCPLKHRKCLTEQAPKTALEKLAKLLKQTNQNSIPA